MFDCNSGLYNNGDVASLPSGSDAHGLVRHLSFHDVLIYKLKCKETGWT